MDDHPSTLIMTAWVHPDFFPAVTYFFSRSYSIRFRSEAEGSAILSNHHILSRSAWIEHHFSASIPDVHPSILYRIHCDRNTTFLSSVKIGTSRVHCRIRINPINGYSRISWGYISSIHHNPFAIWLSNSRLFERINNINPNMKHKV